MIAIHVIDSDAAVRLTARRVLEAAGFVVTEAAAAGCAPPAGPDLVIADRAAASASAVRRLYPAARALAMSEDANGDNLTKPFTPSQLLAAVRLCLARPARGPRC